jgi:hypothetical protein
LQPKVFVGFFAVAAFSNETLSKSGNSLELQQMVEGISDISLDGLLNKPLRIELGLG